MLAVILAAGIASRLRPLTDNTPKCLLKIGEQCLLQRSFDALLKNGIQDFVVVTGYRQQQIVDFLNANYPQAHITFIYNERYDSTNNIYSLWLTRKECDGKDILLLDSDILYDADIVARLLSCGKKDALAVNRHELGDEEIKVITDSEGFVKEISKVCSIADAMGESIGIEKMSAEYTAALFKELQQMIEGEGLDNVFYERAFERLIPQGHRFYALDTTGLFSVELDTVEDFQQAQSITPTPPIKGGGGTYDIRPLQLRILDILLAVQDVCEKHSLRYYIIAGTLLGAVRHKGFIPWDDDLDIAMPRRDYDLLMSHASEWMPKPFEVVAYETDKDYPLPFAKIQDASTTLIERAHLRYLGGIYIDVFPLDGVPTNKLARRLHFIRYQWYKKALYFVHRDPYRHGHGPSSWLPLLCRKLYTMSEIQEKLRRLQKSCDYGQSSFIVDHDDGLQGVMPKSVIGKPTPIGFEGKKVMGVEHPHEYLSQKYGDYMTIPPSPKQRQHNFHLLDLEKPYRRE